MTEEWRSVINFEGLYEVSNFGKVRNFKNKRYLKPRTTTPKSQIEQGRKHYYQLRLYKDGASTYVRLHTVVALAFLGQKPKWATGVDHIDRNPSNNAVSNLRWADSKMQANNRDNSAYEKLNGRPVINNLGMKFPSMRSASNYYGIDRASINHCCLGNRHTAGGMEWRYDD